jgi:hypothetical protein
MSQPTPEDKITYDDVAKAAKIAYASEDKIRQEAAETQKILTIIHSRACYWGSDRCKRSSTEGELERQKIRDAHSKVEALIKEGKLKTAMQGRIEYILDPAPAYTNMAERPSSTGRESDENQPSSTSSTS